MKEKIFSKKNKSKILKKIKTQNFKNSKDKKDKKLTSQCKINFPMLKKKIFLKFIKKPQR